MSIKELIDYLEDKCIDVDKKWYFHATDRNIDTIEKILKEGIKSSFLRKEICSHGYNGKYYVSLCKKNDNIFGNLICIIASTIGLFLYITRFIVSS